MNLEESTDYLNHVMGRFYSIGIDENGGVTRLAYSKEEDQMHDELSRIGKEEGYLVSTDEVGNTFLSIDEYEEYYFIWA